MQPRTSCLALYINVSTPSQRLHSNSNHKSRKLMESLGKQAVAILFLSAALLVISVSHRADAICNMSSEGMDACKPSVSGPNPKDPPSPECCSALATADLECLCSYRNSALLPSLGINPDLAMQLPKKCGLTPPEDCS